MKAENGDTVLRVPVGTDRVVTIGDTDDGVPGTAVRRSYFVGGRMTVSITWITPLLAWMSVAVTVDA